MLRIAVILGVLAVVSAAAGIFLAESAVHVYRSLRWLPPRDVPEGVARAAGASLRDAEIRVDGVPLRAWVYVPGSGNKGAVLMLHGLGASRQHLIGHAGMLVKHGYTVITPDNRGHGESGGGLFTYGLRETADVRAWLNYAREDLKADRLFALGESMGAAILLQMLAVDQRIRAAVAEAPFARFEDIARARTGERLGIPIHWPVVESAFLYTRLRYGVDLKLADPLAVSPRLSVPVLLIHSPADANIPVSHSRRLRESNPRWFELWEPAGIEHTQTAAQIPREFERRVLEHFEKASK